MGITDNRLLAARLLVGDDPASTSPARRACRERQSPFDRSATSGVRPADRHRKSVTDGRGNQPGPGRSSGGARGGAVPTAGEAAAGRGSRAATGVLLMLDVLHHRRFSWLPKEWGRAYATPAFVLTCATHVPVTLTKYAAKGRSIARGRSLAFHLVIEAAASYMIAAVYLCLCFCLLCRSAITDPPGADMAVFCPSSPAARCSRTSDRAAAADRVSR